MDHNNKLTAQDTFLKYVKSLIVLEEVLQDGNSQKKGSAWQRFVQYATAWRKQLATIGIPLGYSNYEMVELASQPISVFEIPSLLELTEEMDIPVFEKRASCIHPYWREFIEELNNEDLQSKHFYRLLNLMDRLELNGEGDYHNIFMNFRDQLSRREYPCFMPVKDKVKLMKPFKEVSELYSMIEEFFEPIFVESDNVWLCPHCGFPHFSDKIQTCIHSRCQSFIQLEGMTKCSINVHSKYVRLSNWVMRFIRIPGLEERRIGLATEKIIKKYGTSEKVKYNPDRDRVDLSVDGEVPLIQADIKDVFFPWTLSKILRDYGLNKKGPLNKIYIVIPQDLVNQYSTSYIERVTNELSLDQREVLEVISEHKWYEKVRDILRQSVGMDDTDGKRVKV